MRFVLLFLFLSSIARADLVLGIGAGKNILSTNPGTPFERVASVGYQKYLSSDFFIRPETGYFEDISGSGKSSLWIAPLAGIRALSKTGPELHIAAGPGYLQNPDQELGGHFQFSLEGGAGISDSHTYIGIAWKHLSSAGLEMPNHGRDFIVIQLRLLNF